MLILTLTLILKLTPNLGPKPDILILKPQNPKPEPKDLHLNLNHNCNHDPLPWIEPLNHWTLIQALTLNPEPKLLNLTWTPDPDL